jgi:protein-arginine deiminase
LICALVGLSIQSGPLADEASAQAERRTRIIIPNVDDDDGDGLPDASARTPGASDEELLPITVRPRSPLPEGAALRVEAAEPWTSLTRAFVRDAASGALLQILNPVGVDAAEAGRGGVRIFVEVADFADAGRPPALDLKVRFETRDGRPVCEETVPCAVAPFLLSCCLDPAEVVHVVRTKPTARFVTDLEPLVRAAGAELRVIADASLPDHDIWIQDGTEIGSAGDGGRAIHVALHGNRGMRLDGLFAAGFLGKDAGFIRKGSDRGRSAEWIDWFGNLEVSPPLAAGGREYPFGRAYAGTQGVRAMHPDVIRFLDAQSVQGPVLWLDTSWLLIGHVDETVSWVPSRIGRSYRMIVPSPRLALEILAKAEADAPGCILNRGTKRPMDKPGESSERTVAEALADKALLAAQDFVQGKIDAVRRTLQAELGVPDADIIEIPVLFNTFPGRFAGRYEAFTPNMVNSLLVNETLIAPDPHGPFVDGKDVLLQAVKDRLEPLGCRVVAVDNFDSYHRWAGEVHCGTNATRRPSK